MTKKNEKWYVNVKDHNGEEIAAELPINRIARSISNEQFSTLVSDFLNTFDNAFNKGKEIGETLRGDHRTLQRAEVLFALGIIVGLSDQEYTDPRNETAIETAKRIAAMVENGELPFGPFV